MGLWWALAGFSAWGGGGADSLQGVLATELHDTTRIQVLLAWSNALGQEGDFEGGIAAGEQALDECRQLLSAREWVAFAKDARQRAYQQIGMNLEHTDRHAEAVSSYKEALQLAIQDNLPEHQCKLLGHLGMYYYNVGDYPQALDFSLRQLNMAKRLNNKQRMASAYNRIGITYKRQMMHEEALSNLFRSVELYDELDARPLLANGYNNIGNVYFNMKKYDLAYAYYQKEKAIGQEVQDMELIADADNCTALIFNEISAYPADSIRAFFGAEPGLETTADRKVVLDSAEHYFKLAIAVYDSLHANYQLADCYNGLAATHTLRGDWDQAIACYRRGFELAGDNGVMEKEMTASYGLFRNYRNKGQFEESLHWYEIYNTLKDSVFSASNSRELGRLQSKNEFEIKEAALRAEQEHERELAEAGRQKQQVILAIVSVGLILVFGLLVFLFNRFRLIKKQKRAIEYHKAEVEAKQKEIVDSITYAKRLQHAILAREENITRFFPQSFLLYKPKDIVAGDFYFFETTDTHVFYAAADCTGHGVPGAMVSIVCSNALTRSIKEFGMTDPGKILDKTRELVVETFEKSGADVKDGMDISLLAKNLSTNEIAWSGAHNPLWVIENNVLQEIKPDKQPIGKSENTVPFKTHRIQASASAILYLFTDGYADQFGGDKGKKFKAAQLKELLLSLCAQSMAEQKQVIEQTFESWRGSLEQVDDVCVIGVCAGTGRS